MTSSGGASVSENLKIIDEWLGAQGKKVDPTSHVTKLVKNAIFTSTPLILVSFFGYLMMDSNTDDCCRCSDGGVRQLKNR